MKQVKQDSCIAGCQYMPSAAYFAHWLYHGKMIIEKWEHYQKRTWRNKTAIQGKLAPIALTVPLQKGKHQQMNIAMVRIAYDEPWAKQHLESFRSAYGKTPFFDEILPGLEILLHARHDTLWSLNIEALSWITSLIPGTWDIGFTDTFYPDYDDNIADLRKGVAPGSTNVVPEYEQIQRIGQPHQPNLSILDALCHLGPATRDYLGRYANTLYTLTS
jgi:hypothetical protein